MKSETAILSLVIALATVAICMCMQTCTDSIRSKIEIHADLMEYHKDEIIRRTR